LVLCFADDNLPGGFVTSGAGAQEEEIWRRTNMCKVLNKYNNYYPLQSNQLLLVSQVSVFKDSSGIFIDPFVIDLINAVAVKSPQIRDDEYANSSEYSSMDNKIRNIFILAIGNKNDSLVLGAFGCGSFSNPPRPVARIFKKYIDIYNKYFKHIGFAILGSNYETFLSILTEVKI
jgi:uncharacterized protein (TIGR02452 family)